MTGSGAVLNVLAPSAGESIEAKREITDGRGVSYALDTTGVPPVFSQMTKSLALRGHGALVGAAKLGTEAPFDIGTLLTSGINISISRSWSRRTTSRTSTRHSPTVSRAPRSNRSLSTDLSSGTMVRIHSWMGVGNLNRGSPLPSLCRRLKRRVDSVLLPAPSRRVMIVPIEDGMRKATTNLDKAAEAAPTSQVVHATDHEEKDDDTEASTPDEDRTRDVADHEDEPDP